MGINVAVSIFVEATEEALSRLGAVLRFAEGYAPRSELAGHPASLHPGPIGLIGPGCISNDRRVHTMS